MKKNNYVVLALLICLLSPNLVLGQVRTKWPDNVGRPAGVNLNRPYIPQQQVIQVEIVAPDPLLSKGNFLGHSFGNDYVKPPAKTIIPMKPIVFTAEEQAAINDRVLLWQMDLANKTNDFGLLKMGIRYRDGDGVKKDIPRGIVLLSQAKELGNPDAEREIVKAKIQMSNDLAKSKTIK